MKKIAEQSIALEKHTRYTLISVAVFALSLPIAYVVWFGWKNGLPAAKTDVSTWGTFGDFIGGVLNPLVAFCALYWLTQSIKIQKKELEEARHALNNQSAMLDKQRFEDTFFSLLEQHNAALKSLTEITSRDLERKSDSSEIMHSIFLKVKTRSLEDANKILKENDPLCGHYFRILFQLLKLIAIRCPGTTLGDKFNAKNILENSPSEEEKMYSNITRAFLDVSTTQLLAINCYCDTQNSTYWNYKCLVERYEFLEHMPFNINGEESSEVLLETKTHYLQKAFGKSDFL